MARGPRRGRGHPAQPLFSNWYAISLRLRPCQTGWDQALQQGPVDSAAVPYSAHRGLSVADNQATHLYVVLQGSYRSAGLIGETWQTGLRFATRPGLVQPVDVGDFIPFGVVAANHNIVETGWTITGNWTTEMGVSDLNPADWLNDYIAPAASGLIASANFSSDVQLDAALVYPIRSPDGVVQPAIPYSQGSPVRCDYTGTKPSGTGAQSLPLQISCAAGLRGSQVGRRGRGRMFLPASPVSYMGNGLWTSGAVTALSTAMKGFIEGTRLDGNSGGVFATPCITGLPFTAYSLIQQIRLDNIPDTQQRRRRSLAGTVTNTAISPY